MVLQALGSGEHGVVVGHDHGALAVDRPDAADEAVGRRSFDKLLDGPAPALGGYHERAVFDEAPRVAQIVDILPCGPLVRAPAAGDRIRPPLVPRHRVALGDLGQVSAGRLRFFGGDDGVYGPVITAKVGGGGVDPQQDVARVHGLARRNRHLGDLPARLGVEDVLHLHRLDHQQLLARVDDVAEAYVDRDDRALHRRFECLRCHA